MHTNVDEIGDGIYRLSTLIPDIGPTRIPIQPVSRR